MHEHTEIERAATAPRSRPTTPVRGGGGRVLWIAPKWPLPAEDGARLATCDLIRSAARHHEVHLLALAAADERCDRDEARAKLGLASAKVVRRPDALSSSQLVRFARAGLERPRLPLSAAIYGLGELQRRAAAFLTAHGPFALTVIDGVQGAAAFASGSGFTPDPRLGAIVYRAHNVESDLFAQRASSAGSLFFRRGLYAVEARKMVGFEGAVIGAAAAVLTVSDDDAARFRALHPEVRPDPFQCIPIGMDFGALADATPVPARGLHLLFLGRLDWPPNRDGLAWFLREVWPRIAVERADVELEIAGSGDGRYIQPILAALPARGRITLRGRVPSVDDLYRRASVSLAPLFHGSGTRVKVLEASRFRRATLGTALGVQGLGLVADQSYLRAETAEAYVREILALTPERCAAVGDAAFTELRARCDSGVIARRFLDALEPAIDSPRVAFGLA